jgi:YvrJ protein family
MTEMDMLSAIAQVGFPIAVTVYLLIERSKFNEKITENLARITEALERIETDHLNAIRR